MLVIANVSLVLIAMLLSLTLFGVELPSLGQAIHTLDSSEPFCVVEFNSEAREMIDIDACCIAARKQLKCVTQGAEVGGEDVSLHCSTASSVPSYWLNNKAHYYCTETGIWR